jgi:outer membrane protein OmpA-like peptidoglycan-associated protein
MKQIHLSLKIFLITLSLHTALFGQKEKEADKIYDNLGYKTSVALMESNIQKDPSKIDAAHIEKIANSYRLIHDTENAEKWYAELVPISDEPIHLLYYAQALQSNGKYEKAREYFLRYNKQVGASDNRGEVLADAIDRMNEFKVTEIKIQNEQAINSENLDFSPAYYRKGIIFVSSRKPDNPHHQKNDLWTDDNFMTLFYAHKNTDGSLGNVEEFSDQIDSKYHEGSITFSTNGQQLFFTRSNYDHGKKRKSKDGVIRLSIYSSVKKSGEWSSPTVLPFSTDEYDETHPSLSSDHTRLFFSSNRAGGYGGMDLYIAEYKLGQWSEPVNLGPSINTPGNELFPFIHDDGTLYFSSNGLGGIGGLDIFSTVLKDDKNWDTPYNIGLPFNSPKDDFGFILNVLSTEGYFSSARNGGVGLDDIYSFVMPPDAIKKQQIGKALCVFEKMSGDLLPDAAVAIVERGEDPSVFTLSDGQTLYIPPAKTEEVRMSILRDRVLAKAKSNESLFAYTNADGQLPVNLDSEKEYIFIAQKENYRMADKVFSSKGKDGGLRSDLCIPMMASNCLNIEGVVTNLKDGNRIANATVTLTNNCTNEILAVESDLLGTFSFPCLDVKCEYTLKGQKVYFNEVVQQINLPQKDLADLDKLYYNIQLGSIYDQSGPSIATSDKNNPGTLTVGTVIELENIYYDFDDYHIRVGAAETLNKVVALLNQYPSMHIELSAHTDCRGDWKYNRQLSKNRAKYAVKYLIKNGVDARRLKYSGWGESRLRNRCEDKVSCSEEEHQYNRRTEIKVTQFDRPDISLRYIDNPPEVIDAYVPGRK